MTDFFSRLEDHLDEAARREASGEKAPRRTPRPTLRAVAVMAAVLAVVAAGVAAFPRIAADDTERAADTGLTPAVEPAPECDKHDRTLPSEGGSFPEQIRSRFSVFAEDSKAEQVRPAVEGFAGLPVAGLQTKEARLVKKEGDVEVYLLAVAHVDDEKRCASVPGDASTEQQARAALPDRLSPGVCLLLQGEKSHASACWSLKTIDAGESVIGPKPFDLLVAAVPDGHPTVEVGRVVGDEPFEGGVADVASNVGIVKAVRLQPGPIRWRDPGLTPVDKTYNPPDYGCGGPVHPETLAAYSVLRNDPDPEGFKEVDPPEGITFLKEPVLAREAFGAKFWLIPAADQADCAKPVICVATDFGATAPQCSPVIEGRSTPLTTRLEPGGEPDLVLFAAAPDDMTGQRLVREGIDPIELSFRQNLLLAGGKFGEERARRIGEAVAGTVLPQGGDGLTADHDDR